MYQNSPSLLLYVRGQRQRGQRQRGQRWSFQGPSIMRTPSLAGV